MATIRTVMTAAAALCAVAWSTHVPALAQTSSKAPLNIVATAKQETAPARVKTKKSAATKKVSRKTASSKTASSKTASPKTASSKTASSKRSKDLRTATGTSTATGDSKARTPRAQTARRTVRQPAPPLPEPEEAVLPEPEEAFAQASDGHVMGGADSVSLIARLPWWRNDRMQTIRYGTPQAQSQVLAAAEAWLANNDTSDDTFDGRPGNAIDTMGLAPAASASSRLSDGGLPKGDSLLVANAAEHNDLDEAASQAPPPPPVDRTFLHSILAMLGGALAAVVSARFLFA